MVACQTNECLPKGIRRASMTPGKAHEQISGISGISVSSRSANRTRLGIFTVNREIMYDISVCAITRRVLVFTGVMVFACSSVRVIYSQNDGIKFRVDDLHDRVVILEQLPAQVSAIKAQIDAMRHDEQEQNANSSQAQIGLMVGVGVLLIEKLLGVVGVKIKGS